MSDGNRYRATDVDRFRVPIPFAETTNTGLMADTAAFLRAAATVQVLSHESEAAALRARIREIEEEGK